jgi:thiol-disulfide isomerase/thioredoxin
VLSKDCHFCEESAPFYRQLGQEFAASGKLPLVAVFPQEKDVAQNYLQGKQISVSEVLQASPLSFGVRGTPTLLLVNGSGEVTAAWYGKLSETEEKKAWETIRAAQVS